jgi:hypothetical protein
MNNEFFWIRISFGGVACVESAVFASICVNFVLCLTYVNVPKLSGNIYNFQTLELELWVKCTPM